MGKKIVLGICAVLMALGFVSCMGGFLLGGTIGSLNVRNGYWVYDGGGESYTLRSAPRWLDGIHWFSWGGWGNRERAQTHNAGETDIARPALTNADSYTPTQNVNGVELHVAAGYLTVEIGTDFRLEVEGPIVPSVGYDDGVWELDATPGVAGATSSRQIDGRTHFFRGGEDITTDYILTVPAGADLAELSLDAGTLIILSLDVEELDLHVNAAAVEARNIRAERAEFSANASALEIWDFTGEYCELSTNAGAIDFAGEVYTLLEVECAAGAVDVSLPRPDEFDYEVSGALTSIVVDGTEMTNYLGGDRTRRTGAALTLKLSCTAGAINIAFT